MNFTEVASKIQNKLLSDNHNILLFAFNATGKTRLSLELSHSTEEEKVNELEILCFNSIIEDYFTWDNENFIFHIQRNSWITRFILEQGIENNIIDNFKEAIGINIEPKFDLKNGNIEFINLTSPDLLKKIKISKGEETIFKWVIFYTILDSAIDILSDKKEYRITDIFDKTKYVIIDDPVSSIDDYRIYTVAMQILTALQKINKINEKEFVLHLPFLITTHHALFYNILYNTMKNNKKKNMFIFLKKNTNNALSIEEHKENRSFSYHLVVMEELKNAVSTNEIYKKHFNLFRSILEKTSIFLGYEKWQDIFSGYSDFMKINKILNMNSHEKYVEIETEYLNQEQIEIFKNGFEWFLTNYKFLL